MKKPRRKWVTSRDIKADLVAEIVQSHPAHTIAYLSMRTKASETQCSIALGREIRRGRVEYRHDTDTYHLTAHRAKGRFHVHH